MIRTKSETAPRAAWQGRNGANQPSAEASFLPNCTILSGLQTPCYPTDRTQATKLHLLKIFGASFGLSFSADEVGE